MAAVSSRANMPFAAGSPPPFVKREEGMNRLRALSDPLSRGGAFVEGDPGNLDAEPNPFEQSFSGPSPTHSSNATHQAASGSRWPGPVVTAASNAPRRARSNSPPAPRMTPGGLTKLPPLALMGTPSSELSNFGWGVDSLRTGPLSPALLNGPAGAPGLYDPSNLRTGLTPLASGVSFPPPSPATAALFAMMTNNTPGAADSGLAGGGSRPHEGPNEGNNFEASFAQAAPPKNAGPDARRPPQGEHQHQQNEYPTHTGMHGGGPSDGSRAGPSRSMAPQAMHPSQLANQMLPYQHQQLMQQQSQQQQLLQQQQHQQMQHAPHQPHHPHHLSQPPPPPPQYGNQNPLYLLSQASSHNDDAVVAAAALSNLGGPAAYPPEAMSNGVVPGAVGGGQHVMPQARGKAASPAISNGAKRKRNAAGAAATPPPAGGNKRKAKEEDKKPAVKKGRKGKAAPSEDEDDDDDDGQDDEGASPQPSNPNETEEEKRKNFLERNRQAALKCRQRKKAWLANLQSKVELLTTDNDVLQSTVTNLKDEVASLRAILAAHQNCPVGGRANGGRGFYAP